jgi:tRNA threonylcarbamoyladenosine biosynthesis protein TsaE
MHVLSKTFHSNSVASTQKLAMRLAARLKAGDVLLFQAPMGAGKTAFIQGLARGLGAVETALSPTFIVANTIEGDIPLHHLDFYRLTKKQIIERGFQDYFLGQGEIEKGVVAVEWADRCKPLWPKNHLLIGIKLVRRSTGRDITLSAQGEHFERVLSSLENA